MSRLSPKGNLNQFLSSRKFSQREKRSLSRNSSDAQLDTRFARQGNLLRRNENEEETTNKNSRPQYQDEEQEVYYQPKSARLPIKKIRSIEDTQDLYSRRHRQKDQRQSQSEQQFSGSQRLRQNTHSGDNFQSSRREAKQFVESLSRKINVEIGNINNTIEEFNRGIKKTIETEYARLRSVIKNTVQQILESEQDNIRKLAKQQQKLVSQQLSQVRIDLQNMFGRLQRYKQNLDGPNWKKTTGQLLSSDIQSQVHDILRRSQRLKMSKSIRIKFDQKKHTAFIEALEQLLQVSLTAFVDVNQGQIGLVN